MSDREHDQDPQKQAGQGVFDPLSGELLGDLPDDQAALYAGVTDDELDGSFDDGDVDQGEADDEPGVARRALGSPVLLLAVTAVAIWGLLGWVDELAYFFSDTPVVTVGRAEELGREVPVPADGQLVAFEGITDSRVFKSDRGFWFLRTHNRYYHLVGSRIFAQFSYHDEADAESLPVPYEEVAVEGRFRHLNQLEGYQTVKAFLAERFGYDDSQPNYLLMVGELPGSQWRYPVLSGLVALVVLVNLGLLLRQLVMRLRRRREARG